MTINLSVPRQEAELKPRITVIGVGGAGGNAVNNMISANLEGVEFVVTNTDAQAMSQTACEQRIQLGINITQGLGAGSRPDIGRAAAEEALDEILEQLNGTHMCFITAGMGGGTGTGAAPVIARAAREQGMLTVGVVTKPFHFEGAHRMRIAENGIEELQHYVDTLIVIPNQNLFRIANERTTFADAFSMADNVLYSGVRGITDLMVMPGLINLDFADIRTVMSEMGKAMMGTGEAEGERRAIDAAEEAISNPLLDDVSMKGARGVLINITGGHDMTLYEVDEAANRIRDEVDPEANIIFGSIFDSQLEGNMRVSVVATGIDSEVASLSPTRTFSVIAGMAEQTLPEAAAESATGPDIAVPIAPAMQATVEVPSEHRVVRPTSALGNLAEAMSAESVQVASAAPDLAVAEIQDEPEAAVPLTEVELVDESAAAEPPAAAESADGLLDPFIAPPPAVARSSALDEADTLPDPFAAAAKAKRGRSPDRVETATAEKGSSPSASDDGRGLSLFEKVTGVGRLRRPVRAEPEPYTVARPSVRPEPTVESQGKPRLGGLSPDDRNDVASAEDDLLDIPAFLRRQAN